MSLQTGQKHDIGIEYVQPDQPQLQADIDVSGQFKTKEPLIYSERSRL